MNDKTMIIISLSAIVCVAIICGTIIHLNNNSNNHFVTKDNDTINITNESLNSTDNNNTTLNSNEKQGKSSHKSSKKSSSSTSKSKKSSSYRPDVDSSGITREQADYFGYTYTPEHGGHYIGYNDHWDPEAGVYHD